MGGNCIETFGTAVECPSERDTCCLTAVHFKPSPGGATYLNAEATLVLPESLFVCSEYSPSLVSGLFPF